VSVDGLPRAPGCRRADCPHRDRRLKSARVECECGETFVLRFGGRVVRLSELPPPVPEPAAGPRQGGYRLNTGLFDWFLKHRGRRHPRDPRGG
jgi:hypothetical protein